MKGNDRSIVGLVMMAHAMVHTYELSIPIFVSIWLTEFPVTEAQLGLLVTGGMALFGIGALPGGILADRWGSKRLILLCLAGMGGSFLLLGVASSIPVIAAALVFWGAAASVYHPAGLSLISRGVTQRGQAFAFHGIAGNFGIAVGPLVTIVLLLFFDWHTVAMLLTIPAGLALLLAVSVDIDERAAVEADLATDVTETDGGERGKSNIDSLREFLTRSRNLFVGGFVLVFVVAICSGLYYRSVLTFLPELLGDLPYLDPVALGALSLEPARYVYVGLLMVGMAGQYVGGRLTERMAVERGIFLAFAALAVIALLYLPLATSGLLGLLVISAVLGFALFVVQPMYQAAVADYSPSDIRGLSYGYTYFSVFGVGALGAVIAGTILTYFSPTVLFVVVAGFAATGAVLGLALSLRSSP
ncbi:MFS transporter [Halobacteriales archaeon Cl-PHB]